MERTIMHKRILWITETAVLLALLIVLQALTKSAGQLVTGSVVNAVLALAALFGGLWCGLVVALVSPLMAFLLGIAPQALTVPAIMAGNGVFVLALYFLAGRTGKPLWRQAAAWLAAAAAKFAVLYGLVVGVICGLFAASVPAPMLQKLPAMFTWPQLFTALIGGGVAMLLMPVLRKALKR